MADPPRLPKAGAARWLLYAHNRLAVPALLEVFEACAGRPEVEAWLAFEEEPVEAAAPAAFPARRVPVREAAGRRWDLVLAADNQRGERVPDGPRVRLPHGGSYGLHGYGIVSLGRCDLFVATSEAQRVFLERHRHLTGATAPVVVGGHPRLDRLWRGRRERSEVLDGLGLDPARPTVAIASHWTPLGNLRRFGAALPRTILSVLPEANVVQAGHPNIWQRVRYDIADPRATLLSRALGKLRRELRPFDYDGLFRDLEALASAEARFRLLPPDRTFDALAAADVLVTDWSSVTVEFTLFDRPIVLHRPPGFRAFDAGLEAAYLAASDPFSDLAEVGAALREALSAPGAKRPGRTALRDLCLEYRGTAGKRIVEVLLDFSTSRDRGARRV